MVSKVAVVEFEDAAKSLELALGLIGNMGDLNTSKRSVTVKVGVFDPKAENHASVPVVDAIIKNFNKAPRIFLAESDNYKGARANVSKLRADRSFDCLAASFFLLRPAWMMQGNGV